MSEACAKTSKVTLPPCGATPINTAAVGITSDKTSAQVRLTTKSQTCQGGSKDIFLAIDASDTIGHKGWQLQKKFAQDLVDEILKGGNPKGHRINAHWFNDVTAPFGAAAGVVEPTGSSHPNTGNNEDIASNDIGLFTSDPAKIKDEIGALPYRTIVDEARDHPQVFLTAAHAFARNKAQGREQILVLITDGETHNGEDCPMQKDKKTVFLATGSCDEKKDHVCQRTNGQTSCNLQTCICGLFTATKFKKDHTLAVVAVPNQRIDATTAGFTKEIFKKQMRQMASANRLYFAENLESLQGVKNDLVGDVCDDRDDSGQCGFLKLTKEDSCVNGTAYATGPSMRRMSCRRSHHLSSRHLTSSGDGPNMLQVQSDADCAVLCDATPGCVGFDIGTHSGKTQCSLCKNLPSSCLEIEGIAKSDKEGRHFYKTTGCAET
jgi:hypothetical protein